MNKQPYLTINIIGILSVILCFLSEQWSWCGFYLILNTILYSAFGICLLILLAANVAAYAAVINEKPVLGVILSLPFGSLGAFIAMKKCHTSHKNDKAIKIIFNIHFWIAAWLVVSFLLYLLGYHDFRLVGI